MNILFTLCGRAGSKGVKGKNSRDFLDIPLVWYSIAGISQYIKSFKSSEDIIDVVLNTDSDDLVKLVKAVKDIDIIYFRRSAELAGDRVPKTAVILDSLIRAENYFNKEYDITVDLDITSPLRTAYDIHRAIERKKYRPETNVVYSVVHSRRNPYFNMVKAEGDYFVDAFPSQYTTRQEAPSFYDMNASIYVYSAKSLKTMPLNTIFNYSCDAIIMNDTGILDIDSEEDYELMQVVARYLFANKPGYTEIFFEAMNMKEKYLL